MRKSLGETLVKSNPLFTDKPIQQLHRILQLFRLQMGIPLVMASILLPSNSCNARICTPFMAKANLRNPLFHLFTLSSHPTPKLSPPLSPA
jgi:hypothetical protein